MRSDRVREIDPEVNEVLLSPKWLIGMLATAVLVAAAVAGCGGGDESATPLNIGVTEKGKTTSFSVPKSADGGLVEVKLTNEGKAPHGVQFIRYEDGHTSQEAMKEVENESAKTPDWIRAEGGIGGVSGGQTGTATLNLEAGNFVIADTAASGSKPATAQVTVTEGNEGDLPSTEATVAAEETGKDEYAWGISGLEAGKSEVTFDSEGDDALHLIVAAPLKGKIPPLSQIKKELSEENGPPPSYLDFESAQSTAVLDGEKSQTTTLDLKPGKYLFFCPLTDRDGGKSHDQEGLLSVETVE